MRLLLLLLLMVFGDHGRSRVGSRRRCRRRHTQSPGGGRTEVRPDRSGRRDGRLRQICDVAGSERVCHVVVTSGSRRRRGNRRAGRGNDGGRSHRLRVVKRRRDGERIDVVRRRRRRRMRVAGITGGVTERRRHHRRRPVPVGMHRTSVAHKYRNGNTSGVRRSGSGERRMSAGRERRMMMMMWMMMMVRDVMRRGPECHVCLSGRVHGVRRHLQRLVLTLSLAFVSSVLKPNFHLDKSSK